MQPEFLEKLQTIRDLYGKPIRLNSGYRCPEFNATISKTGPDGPHTTGRAVDIAISGQDALHVPGLGVEQWLHRDRIISNRGLRWTVLAR